MQKFLDSDSLIPGGPILRLPEEATDSNAAGVIKEEVEVGGYICGDSQKAKIWRPHKILPGSHPVISFAHGWHNGGDSINNYENLLSGLAKEGYIVIGNLSAYDQYCRKETQNDLSKLSSGLKAATSTVK